MGRLKGCWIFLFLLLNPGIVSADLQSLIEAMNKLPPAERHEKLVDGARKEGSVMLYSSSGIEEIKALTKLFAKKYPFIDIRYLKKGGSQLYKVALLEFSTNQTLADVFWAGVSSVGPMVRERGMLSPYFSPERDAIPDEFKDPRGLWTGTRVSVVVFPYHAHNVPPGKVPTKYEDLLDPFWKGNLSSDTNPGRWTRVVVETMGWEKAEQFHRKLAAQEMRLYRGRSARTQLILAGETLGTLDVNADNIAALQNQGAPLEYSFIDPTIFSITSAALPKAPPHPHAALLLYDLIISREGQAELAREDNVPVREDVEVKAKKLGRQFKQLRKEKRFTAQSPGTYDPDLEEKYDQLYIKTIVRRSR